MYNESILKNKGEKMRISKIFAGLFGIVGAVLLAGTAYLSITSLDAPTELVTPPPAALECCETMMEAIGRGDFAAAGDMMYGTPDLGADREASDEVGIMIWDAFLASISYEFIGDCYATESGIARDVAIETLDISSVTEGLKERAQTLLAQRVAEAEDIEQIYNENGEYREDFVMECLYDAATAAMQEDAENVRRELTLNLVYSNEQWWVMPEQTLISAISGGIA